MSDGNHKGTVRRVWDETPRLKGILLEVSDEVAAAYSRAGQVVVLKPNAESKVYLAIASSPDEANAIELLLGEGAASKLPLEVGAEIELDPPSGNGFPIERAAGKDVLLFAVGSALAPIRPVVSHIRKNRSDYGRVTLYVGAHTAEDFPYQSEFDAWKRDRIDVVQSISKPWVQQRFEEEKLSVDNAVAYICGMKEMMADVTASLVAAGMAPEDIGRNW